MREREAKRKYLWELGLSLAAYGVVLFAALHFGRGLEPGAVRTLILVAPMLPVLLAVWAIVRGFRRMDEFVRLRTLESLAFAAAVTAALSFTYGFLEVAGFPRLSMFWVWGVLGFAWWAHNNLRRYFAG